MIPFVLGLDEPVDVRAAAERGWGPAIRFGIPASARRGFLWYVAPLAVMVFGFPSMAFALFPVVLSDEVNASPVVLTGLSGLCTAWGGLLARPLLTLVAPRMAMVWGATIGTAGYVMGTVAIVTGTWPLLWPAAVVLGAASGVLSVASLTIVGEITDDANRGALSSTFYLVAYCGMTMPLWVSVLSQTFATTPVLVGLTLVAATLTVTTPLRQRLAAL